MKYGFIGYGNMGSALGNALSSNCEVQYFDLIDKSIDTIEELIQWSDIIVLAVKPFQYQDVLQQYDFSNVCVISIAAGISSKFMQKYCKSFVLAMPNTAVLVNEGVVALVKTNHQYYQEVKNDFNAISKVIEIEEEQLPAIIALSGSSPAYFYEFFANIVDFHKSTTISEEDAKLLVLQVLKGVVKMLEVNSDAKQLVSNVCSPNGTTIQAIDNFRNQQLETIVHQSMQLCLNKAIEMTNMEDNKL